jgi:hypothetical protein
MLLTDTNRPIIFYSGTIPILSLIQTTLEIACLHVSAFLPKTFFLIVAATGSLAWLVQASIWTSCELSGGLPAPGKRITTPQWCPQFSFTNHGGNLSTTLTIVKITLAWAMLSVYLLRVAVASLDLQQMSEGKGFHEFHELVEIQPHTPRRTKARPYTSTFQQAQADKTPAMQILSGPSRP